MFIVVKFDGNQLRLYTFGTLRWKSNMCGTELSSLLLLCTFLLVQCTPTSSTKGCALLLLEVFVLLSGACPFFGQAVANEAISGLKFSGGIHAIVYQSKALASATTEGYLKSKAEDVLRISFKNLI